MGFYFFSYRQALQKKFQFAIKVFETWAYMSGHEEVVTEAATVSTIYTTEGTLADMVSDAIVTGSLLGASGVCFLVNRALGEVIDTAVQPARKHSCFYHCC